MSTRWRLLDDPAPRDGVRNMAVDAALLDSVAAGAAPVFRLYRWSPATLSFGRNQPARGLYDEAAAAARGIAFVRRPTGGQAVLHDDELTYAVAAPIAILGRPRAAYRSINRALVAGLRRLGVDARVADGADGADGPPRAPGRSGAGIDAPAVDDPGAAPADWRLACFRTPASGEVVASGRKLVGSAQRTQDRTILQHGSILLGGSQAAAEALLADPVPTSPGGWTTVEAELGRRPGRGRVREALIAGFEESLGIQLAPSDLTDEEMRGVEAWRPRIGSSAWTWRR